MRTGQVRVFDRLYNPSANGRRSVLASNGDVVEARAIGAEGMLVRNAAGAEGVVAWKKIQSGPGEPVRLAYGYATTVDVPKAAPQPSTYTPCCRARKPHTA